MSKRIKIYTPVVITLYVREDGTPYARRQTCEPMSTWTSANNWNVSRIEALKEYESAEDGTKTFKGYMSGIKDVYSFVNEAIIDVDDFDEYKPVFEVEVTVTTEKRFTVEIDTNDGEHEDVNDEYDAEARVKDMIEMGEMDDELEYADVWDTDIECSACEQ